MDDLTEVMRLACAGMGLESRGAELVQHAANALYRLPASGVMLRPSPGPAEQLVRVAGALEAAGVPIGKLAPGVPQAFDAAGWAATAWVLHPALAVRLPTAELAGPLTSLHAARLPIALPPWDLVGAIAAYLARHHIPEPWVRRELLALRLTASALTQRLLTLCDEIADDLTRVHWALPPGTVHGDAHPGNLLRTAEGAAVLCDLDSVAWGPREADLMPAAHGVTRFGRDRADYDRFASRYGYDVLTSPAWPVLHRLRDLQLAFYLLPRPPADHTASAELAHRVKTVLTGDQNARWHRFTAYA